MSWLTTSAPDSARALAFLLDSAIKGAIVILIAAAVTWMLRRRSAAARHTVWSAAIAAQLLMPMLGLLLPAWRVPVLDEPSWAASPTLSTPDAPPVEAKPKSVAAPTKQIVIEDAPTTGAPAASPTPPANQNATTPVPKQRPSSTVVLTALWMLGCIVVLGRLAAGTAVVSRMAGRGERVTDEKWLGLMTRLAVALGIRRPLTLLRGDTLGIPVTWGIVYPVVFLPQDADSWPEERRRYVLVHEMAHVKRLDAFTQLVAQFALAIFWFNPLIWVAASRMRRERENACDDYVLTHGTKPSEYASDLLELVRSIGTRNHRAAEPAFAALAMARRSEFEGRMLSILDPEAPRTSLSRKGVVMSLVTAVLVIVPLAAFSPFAPAQVTGTQVVGGSQVSSTDRTLPTSPTSPSRPTAASSAPKTIVGAKTTGGARTVVTAGGSETMAVPLVSGSASDPCDKLGGASGNSTSIHDDSDSPDSRMIQYVRKSAGRCLEAILIGRVEFSADENDIASMAPSAHARFREVTLSADREIVLVRDGGEVRHDYLVNGKSEVFDDAARNWFATMVLTMLRESGVNAGERVARLRKEGGTARVLSEIDEIASSGAKANYYQALLDDKTLPPADLTLILGRTRRDLSSSGDLRAVLQKASRLNIQSTAVRASLVDAIEGITSDGDKSSLITELVWTADRALLVDLAGVAKTIGSDGDKSSFLTTTASRYLTGRDAGLRNGYFDVASTVGSDGDRQRVYIGAAQYGHGDDAVTSAIIQGTLKMGSSGDRANVLVSVANQRLLTTDKLTAEYIAAANKIDSDGDRARVLRAAGKE
jgi:beta-lactamase regulating signal transducer with metallopeptidase domain